MSELEYLTALSTLRTEVGFHATNFFTIWTAYMVAAYLVGEKLSLTFSLLVTILYTTFLIGPATAILTSIDTAYFIGTEYYAMYPDSLVAPVPQNVGFAVSVTAFSSWLVSILFFLQRKKVLSWK